MKVMLKVDGKNNTGPITIPEGSRVTMLCEVANGDHVWRSEIMVDVWNGIPRIRSVKTSDYVPVLPHG